MNLCADAGVFTWRCVRVDERGALRGVSLRAAASCLRAEEGPVKSSRGCMEGARWMLKAGNLASPRRMGLAPRRWLVGFVRVFSMARARLAADASTSSSRNGTSGRSAAILEARQRHSALCLHMRMHISGMKGPYQA